jgi:hypothetical protein
MTIAAAKAELARLRQSSSAEDRRELMKAERAYALLGLSMSLGWKASGMLGSSPKGGGRGSALAACPVCGRPLDATADFVSRDVARRFLDYEATLLPLLGWAGDYRREHERDSNRRRALKGAARKWLDGFFPDRRGGKFEPPEDLLPYYDELRGCLKEMRIAYRGVGSGGRLRRAVRVVPCWLRDRYPFFTEGEWKRILLPGFSIHPETHVPSELAHQVLASRYGVEPETVRTALKKLRRGGASGR